MDSQFSVSVELSRIVPLLPLVNAASKGLLGLIRSFKNSGSDLTTEYGLAAVLGRTLIDPQFGSTFRNAVRVSSIHKLAGIAELVLEAGAGPTVKHAIDKAPFFAMIVQLSLLLWAHEITSLSSSLAQTLASRSTGDQEIVLRMEDILGTLRCVREQTCGFLWELEFAAVAGILYSYAQRFDVNLDNRSIPHAILSTLIDALPAVQRFPEDHMLVIQSQQGVATIVLWAHHVLGLTVRVEFGAEHKDFGSGAANILISCSYSIGKITLLNKTDDIEFQALEDVGWDQRLWANLRHPLKGYGQRFFLTIRTKFGQLNGTVEHFAFTVIISCLQFAEDRRRKTSTAAPPGCFIPSADRIFVVAKVLFPEQFPEQASLETIKAWLRETRENQPQMQTDELHSKFWVMERIIYSLSLIANLDECLEVPLSLDEAYNGIKTQYGPKDFDCKPNQIFGILSHLLLGYFDRNIESAAVLSSWGWSLCTSSVTARGFGPLRTEVAFVRGVPSRQGERRYGIIDTPILKNTVMNNSEYAIVGRPGEHAPIQAFSNAIEIKHMIGTFDNAFTVSTSIMIIDRKTDRLFYRANFGFRMMQDLYWNTWQLPSCDCGTLFHPGDKILIPSRAWVFQGFPESLSYPEVGAEDPWELIESPPAVSHRIYERVMRAGQTPEEVQAAREARNQRLQERDPECRVHIGLTAGNDHLRWLLLASSSAYRPKAKMPYFNQWFLRKDDCCVDCAVKYIKEHIKGDNRRFAHAGLIT